MPRSRRSDRFCKTKLAAVPRFAGTTRRLTLGMSRRRGNAAPASEIEFCKPKRRKLERAHLGQIF
jgi:hypothetical protein